MTLADTAKLLTVSAVDYDALFHSSGHGPLWDLAEDPQSISLIETMYTAGRSIATVYYAPGVLRHAKASDGSSLVRDKSVTGFANSEEAAIGPTEMAPFLVEDMLKKDGDEHSEGPDQ